jgi:hypothetical protein
VADVESWDKGREPGDQTAFVFLISGLPPPWRVFTFMANFSVSGSIVDKLKLRTSYLNISEVMEILRRSRKTLCAWVQAGDIPAIRRGRDNILIRWSSRSGSKPDNWAVRRNEAPSSEKMRPQLLTWFMYRPLRHPQQFPPGLIEGYPH